MQTTKSRRSRRGLGGGGSKTFSRFNRTSRNPRRSNRRYSNNRGGGFSGTRNRKTRALPTFDPTRFINTNPQEEIVEIYEPKHTFSTLGLDQRVVRSVHDMGITVPTPIQDQIIPEIVKGHDVIGVAETGTGKTASFLVPLLDRTLKAYSEQTLILTPTRELALQIEGELRKLTRHLKIFSTVCVGGTGMGPQIRGLRRKNHFVIGTPGRVMDLIKRNVLRTKDITTVVLDEADRMLDMGFINDMRSILSGVPESRNTLLFSATMDEKSQSFANEFLRNPIRVSVKKRDVIDTIEQSVVGHTEKNKLEILKNLLKEASFKRVIIFCAMKHSTEKLSKELQRNGIKAESIHGNKTHGARQRSLKTFQSGNARVLVATDVAARGIHVDNVSHVINYDLPNTFEDYVHRIGRTGRGTNAGKAITFVAGTH